MIRRLSQRLFTPRYNYTNPLDEQRARSLLLILSFGMIASVFYSAILLFYMVALNAVLTPAQAVSTFAPVVAITAFVLVNRGHLRSAAMIIIILSLITGYLTLNDGLADADTIAIIVPIVIAGVMLDWRGTLLTVAIVIGFIIQVAFFSTLPESATTSNNFGIVVLIVAIVGAWLTIFGSNIQEAARRNLTSVEDFKQILRRVAQTGINTDEQHLSADVIDIVRDQLGYTYAQVYLANEAGAIQQRIAVGLNKTQLNVDTNIRLETENVAYEALRTGQIVTLEVGTYRGRWSHLLPGINTATVVPITIGQQIIGVLDVQRENEEPFTEEELDLLLLLAAHLGSTMLQSRVINELRNDLSEQNNLVIRQREKLLAYEEAEERATTNTWTTYLQQRGLDYLGYDMQFNAPEPTLATSLPQALQLALETGEITVTAEDNQQIVSVPILLRGKVLGAMSFHVPEGKQTIGSRQLDLIRSVVQRLGLALENKRLFEQSRAQAQRESQANLLGGLLLSSTDIETVLKLAAENFNEALGAIQTQIHLQPEAHEMIEG